MSGIRLVAFDFFGTLGRFDRRRPTSPVYVLWAERDHTRPVDLGVLVGMVEGANGVRQFDHAPTADEYRDWQTDALRSAAGYAGVAWTAELHRRLLDTLDQRELVLFDDTVPVLRGLCDRRITWGVSSNASPDVEGKLLDALPAGLHPHLTVMSCRVGARKPHPDMFRPFLSYVDHPGEVLFVGDRVDADILGPSRLGFRTALIAREPDAAAPPGTPVLRALTEIHSLITQEAA
jgi:FMN phosphatase YigB (HAD superfamily)